MSEGPNRSGTADDVLAATLLECRAALSAEPTDRRLELIGELLPRLESDREPGTDDLAGWLADFAGPDDARRETLVDVVNLVVRDLAQGDDPPSAGGAADLWQTLVVLTDRFYGSGVVPLGRLPFISDRLIELLLAESVTAHKREDRAGEAGDVLAKVAVSRKLREAVETAVGFAVVPSYRAVYLYDIPGSHVQTHVDTHDYEVILHLVLEHAVPQGEAGSALVVHLAGQPAARRVRLQPGEALALCGRGTIHSWEPMGPAEHRTLIGLGFQPS
jgi:hypothetical protein